MYRCCLGLLLISHVHTDGSHPVKLTWSVCDLLIDRGFDLARGYRFRVVASWRVILSKVHNVRITFEDRLTVNPSVLCTHFATVKHCAKKYTRSIDGWNHPTINITMENRKFIRFLGVSSPICYREDERRFGTPCIASTWLEVKASLQPRVYEWRKKLSLTSTGLPAVVLPCTCIRGYATHE